MRATYKPLLMSIFLAANAFAGNDITASVSCDGYGYKVKVLINGVDIGITGGKSEATRLFNKDHEMYKEAPPKIRKRLFILKEGENKIKVEFRKEDKEDDKLTLSLELEDYPAPVFLLYSKSRASGTVEKTITLQKNVPKDFKPVYVSDHGENRSAFVHVSTMHTTVTPILNGEKEMTLGGMMGSIPLDNVKLGKNELVIKYKGDPAMADELKFAIITPEWTKFFVRKITDSSEKTETFSFTAK